MPAQRFILITGATGLLGREVLARLLRANPDFRVYALVRDATALAADARIIPIVGDLRSDGLGLAPNDRTALRRDVSAIIHLAADTTFSAPLERARAVNTRGTERVLELADECASGHVAYVSTAFAAGRRTGVITEDAAAATSWVNAYEQSKYEAEVLVRKSPGWVILRSSTVACDDLDGRITQLNAVHRALRLYHEGLAAMMPGVAESAVDVVTTTYVADAIAQLALREDAVGKTVHLCAGAGALRLSELLDITYERWARDTEWKRRRIARPVLCNLETYSLFERSVEQVGDASLKRLTRALSHFVPQLALPKRFATSNADALLGNPAPPVRDFWMRMIDHLVAGNGARATGHGRQLTRSPASHTWHPTPHDPSPVPRSPSPFIDHTVAWINRTLVPPGVTVDADTPLFANGLINSIRILKLIAWTEHALGIRIPDSRIRMDHFRTVRRIAETFATQNGDEDVAA